MPLLSASSNFLLALRGENRGRPPVWLMRQAGRYLPEYQTLRLKHSLKELFFTPSLAKEVTLMPIRRFSFDALILFSDITVVAEALHLSLEFKEGPQVTPLAEPGKTYPCSIDRLLPIFKTVELIKKEEPELPLIGFCGGPFTVASYLIGSLEEAQKWVGKAPFSHLLAQIEEVSIEYLKRQVEAGVDAIQIFDSWANLLSKEQFALYCQPFLERVLSTFDLPVIFFMRGAGRYLEEIPCAVSLDWESSPALIRRQTKKTLQGNLNPDLLFEPLSIIQEQTEALLSSMRDDPAFILNLGHGVKPGTPIDAVRCLVETVRSFS